NEQRNDGQSQQGAAPGELTEREESRERRAEDEGEERRERREQEGVQQELGDVGVEKRAQRGARRRGLRDQHAERKPEDDQEDRGGREPCSHAASPVRVAPTRRATMSTTASPRAPSSTHV